MFDTVEAPRAFDETTRGAIFTDLDGDRIRVAPYTDPQRGNVVRVAILAPISAPIAEVYLTPAQVIHFIEVVKQAAIVAELANVTIDGRPTPPIAREDAYSVG